MVWTKTKRVYTEIIDFLIFFLRQSICKIIIGLGILTIREQENSRDLIPIFPFSDNFKRHR